MRVWSGFHPWLRSVRLRSRIQRFINDLRKLCAQFLHAILEEMTSVVVTADQFGGGDHPSAQVVDHVGRLDRGRIAKDEGQCWAARRDLGSHIVEEGDAPAAAVCLSGDFEPRVFQQLYVFFGCDECKCDNSMGELLKILLPFLLFRLW